MLDDAGRLLRRNLAARLSPRELDHLWVAKSRACAATHAHEIRVGKEVRDLSRHLGWDRQSVDDFTHAAMFHDVGKMLTPRSVLWKAGALSEQEMAVMKRHAEDGASILSRFGGVIGEIGALMAHYHHERPDGFGYYGLVARDIPPFARICAVADVYEALTSERRSYRTRLSDGEALLLMTGRGQRGKLGCDAFDIAALHGFVELKLRSAACELTVDQKGLLGAFVREREPGRDAELAAFELIAEAVARRHLDAGILGDPSVLKISDPEKMEIIARRIGALLPEEPVSGMAA